MPAWALAGFRWQFAGGCGRIRPEPHRARRRSVGEHEIGPQADAADQASEAGGVKKLRKLVVAPPRHEGVTPPRRHTALDGLAEARLELSGNRHPGGVAQRPTDELGLAR